ncbi:MAG: cytochrome c oxidase subunit II [Candidatus Binataceae bacterium]
MIASYFPENVSTFGGSIDHVFWLILYIVGFFFVVAQVLLVYFVIRYRRRAKTPAFYNRGDTPREAAWVLVPALIVLCLDLGIDAAGHRAWDLVKGPPPPAQVEVKVTAKQFNWNFTYPDAAGKLDAADSVTLENELHVPVGKVVRLTLTSEDVIHSLWVPNLRLKQDVVPGRTIIAWFEATKAGHYEIGCTELCGFGHYSMHGDLFVDTEADYAKWRAENLENKSAGN